jgi:hypothetical protein
MLFWLSFWDYRDVRVCAGARIPYFAESENFLSVHAVRKGSNSAEHGILAPDY